MSEPVIRSTQALWVPHLLHLAGLAVVGALLYRWGITVEVMRANGWWLAFVVANLGVLAGNLAMSAMPAVPGDAAAVSSEGRRQDLLDSHKTVVELLRNLEVERPKLDPADYARQREALLSVGAAALRTLEQEAPPPADDPVEAVVAQVRALRELDPARFDAALDRLGLGAAAGVSGEWRGALYALAAVGLVAGLWWSAQDSARPRAPGASMTGGDQPAPMEQPSADPRIAEARQAVEANPEDLAGWNRLTELAIGARDLGQAMEANQRALAIAPADADAVVYRAVLKAFIGRVDEALAELEAAGAAHPTHARAFIYQGLLWLERDPARSVVALEKATTLEDSPQLQEALAVARQRAAMGPPPSTPAPGAAPPAAGAAAPPSAGAVLAAGTLTLSGSAEGASVLFVHLKDPAGGPPLAARKLPPGPFPMEFRITEADRIPMAAGRPMPTRVVLTARLDADGDPLTRPDTDPSGTVEVSPGTEGISLPLD